jgi:2,5-diketo-D-gluconate reductase A
MDKLVKLPNAVFHTGRSIPILGFGTYLLNGKECIDVMKEALGIGYRHFDTASMYGNES